MLSERVSAWSGSIDSVDLSEYFDLLEKLDPEGDPRSAFVVEVVTYEPPGEDLGCVQLCFGDVVIEAGLEGD